MGSKMVKTFHWCCDRKGCNAHGTGDKVPEDWRYLQIFEPHNKPGVKNPRDVSVLLCPPCTALFKNELDIGDQTQAIAV